MDHKKGASPICTFVLSQSAVMWVNIRPFRSPSFFFFEVIGTSFFCLVNVYTYINIFSFFFVLWSPWPCKLKQIQTLNFGVHLLSFVSKKKKEKKEGFWSLVPPPPIFNFGASRCLTILNSDLVVGFPHSCCEQSKTDACSFPIPLFFFFFSFLLAYQLAYRSKITLFFCFTI